MFTTNNNDDAGSVTDLAEKVFGKKLSALQYEAPIYNCSVCGTPCSGVMCLSCATRG